MLVLRTFSEKETEEKQAKGKKLAKVGAAIGATGLATGIAGGVGQNIIADKISEKVAKKTGAIKIGRGMNTAFLGNGKKAGELATRAIKNNKGFKIARAADFAGTGAALTGAGLLVAGKIMAKKKKNDKEDKN